MPYNVFTLETKVTKKGGIIPMGEKVDKQERLTCHRFRESVTEDIEYSNKQLDKDIVNKSQICNIIQAMKDNLLMMFTNRFLAPATLERVRYLRTGPELFLKSLKP